ncbi:MAG: bifunctional folylpolyglutamate synthase/dihydrofolate synthase [Chloroflexi bacterium]|nr:MAG: bifunctional folylpolyglutamate synthase/dihydrofolate synthase [Chloroflexota bacterium]
MTTEAAAELPAMRAYVEAVRRLLDHGGYERTGNPDDARRFRISHVTELLEHLGHPEARRTVHVAGSKGKGSVAVLTEAILRAAGAHTLLLTSPDMHQARERIAIDGAPLAYDRFAALTERLLGLDGVAGFSYFEALTLLGWMAGADAGCDWQVVEVGLGGRLDTTNAMPGKDVAVITPIDLEHTEILGDTIAAIAAEKAGILIGPCDLVTSPMRESALDVIRARAAEVGATHHHVPDECAIRVTKQDLDGTTLDLRTPLRTYRGLTLALLGPHQVENAAAAVLAAEYAWAAAGHELPEQAVRTGLASARWPGRFEVVRRQPLVILDGLHTPLAARRFREAVRVLALPRPRVIVAGLLADKDADAIAAALVEEGDEVIVATPASTRAADPAATRRAFQAAGANAQQAASVEAALQLAIDQVGPRGAVLVVGSIYTVAEARELLLGVTGDRAFGLR